MAGAFYDHLKRRAFLDAVVQLGERPSTTLIVPSFEMTLDLGVRT